MRCRGPMGIIVGEEEEIRALIQNNQHLTFEIEVEEGVWEKPPYDADTHKWYYSGPTIMGIFTQSHIQRLILAQPE